ncbi:unnamed protein product [Albugo candida]|uniref:Apple domain-containing protein n=1 Tax=Albugo candida TaxID=65357 RepID=A0A024FXJ6_9STRA|nr:unnamed protein product [Albugo candida]|eukprot:CCI11627.1 unnamed protein product [Albugo candida]
MWTIFGQSAIVVVTLFQHAFCDVKLLENAQFTGLSINSLTVNDVRICINALQANFFNASAMYPIFLSATSIVCKVMILTSEPTVNPTPNAGHSIYYITTRTPDPPPGPCNLNLCGGSNQCIPLIPEGETCLPSKGYLINVLIFGIDLDLPTKKPTIDDCKAHCMLHTACVGTSYNIINTECQMKGLIINLLRFDDIHSAYVGIQA